MNEFPIQSGTVKLNPSLVNKNVTHTEIGGYEARPSDPTQIKGGVVVIQEIFGVNHSIKATCDQYAKNGYWAVAPALFDHMEKNLELGYDDADMGKGFSLMQTIGFDQFLSDSKQAGIYLNEKLAALSGAKRKTGIVGYCLGGSLVWAATCSTQGIFSAGSGYYGSQVIKMMDGKSSFPTIFHFGEQDKHIPVDEVKKFASLHPETSVYLYPADHGFNNIDKKVFNKDSAKIAFDRTMEFFAKNLT